MARRTGLMRKLPELCTGFVWFWVMVKNLVWAAAAYPNRPCILTPGFLEWNFGGRRGKYDCYDYGYSIPISIPAIVII